MRHLDREKEISLTTRRENWTLIGTNRPVKVLSAEVSQNMGQFRAQSGMRIGGYFTLAMFLIGKTPLEIKEVLGLRRDSMQHGAIILDFLRLPSPTEYTYELTTDHPGGVPETFMSDPNYPPGSPKIHQWQTTRGVSVPVDARNALFLPPGVKFRG